MKRFRKRKGSSLILVVFITAVVFTVATTMIAVVTNDYKTRVNESKKLQNLYQSDAKLDLAYNIISQNAQTATTYAYNVAQYDYNRNHVTNQSDLEEEFQRAFREFLMGKPDGSNERIKYAVENSKKYAFPEDGSVDKVCSEFKEASNYVAENLKDADTDWDAETGVVDKQDGKLTVEDVTIKDNKINITVKSQFYSDNENSSGNAINGKLDNTKTIRTKYIIEAPSYNMPEASTGAANELVYTYAVQKAITADGNLNIVGNNDNNTSLTVDGKDKDNNATSADIWIKGNQKAVNEDYSVAYDKYAYGIRLNNNANLDINGNVYTNGNLTLSNNSSAKIAGEDAGELYAHNAYVGPVDKNQITDRVSGKNTEKGNDNLSANNIYTNNDLVMNSDSSSISADNYVGISSEKEESQTDGSIFNKAKAASNSSSIIVNAKMDSDYTSSIKLNNATVAGFAYMDTAGSSYYATGESVAVKGNYYSYTQSLTTDGEDTSNPEYSVGIKEFDPWKLIEYDNQTKDDAFKSKANHFEQYYNSANFDNLRTGGVVIDNLRSMGAAAYSSNDLKRLNGAASVDIIKEITATQNKSKGYYAKNVFNMGQDTKNNQNYYASVMNDGNMKTVAGKNNTTAAIDFSFLQNRIDEYGLSDLYKFLNPAGVGIYNNKGYSLLNADEDRDLTITKDDSGIHVKLAATTSQKEEAFDVSGASELNAIVITKGNVNLNGDFTINGSIIAGGNVNISAGSNVKVSRDVNVINQVIADNVKYYKNAEGTLFTGNPLSETGDTRPVSPEPDTGADPDNAAKGWYNSQKFIKQGLWKLVNESKGDTSEPK